MKRTYCPEKKARRNNMDSFKYRKNPRIYQMKRKEENNKNWKKEVLVEATAS